MLKAVAVAMALPAVFAHAAGSSQCKHSRTCAAEGAAEENSLLAIGRFRKIQEHQAEVAGCPGSNVGCAGNQCCPPTRFSVPGIPDNKTFPCPTADPDWNQCQTASSKPMEPRLTYDKAVKCPGSGNWCAKNQCCPPIGENDDIYCGDYSPCEDFYPKGVTFPCPLSPLDMDSCEAMAPTGFPGGEPLLCEGDSFFDCFDFFTHTDPTEGYVDYVSREEAEELGLIRITPNNSAYIGSKQTGGPVKSIRLASRRQFNEGIFILDMAHAPDGLGTWPAWWMYGVGAHWPIGGELDMWETVNGIDEAQTAVHSNQVCTMPHLPNITSGGDAGNVIGASVWGIPGSPIINTRQGRHIFAVVWSDSGFDMHYFTTDPSGAVKWPTPPADIDSISPAPNPSTWPAPWRRFPFSETCHAGHFWQMMPTFDLTFCGGWAGNVKPWKNLTQCEDYVRSTPMPEAFWEINFMRVFPLPN